VRKASHSGAISAPLVDHLLVLLQQNHIDHTSFFRHLGAAARGDAEPARGLFLDIAGFDGWMARWQTLGPDADVMDLVNLVYIPRYHLIEEAVAAAKEGDLDLMERLLDAVGAPFDERPGLERYAAPQDFDAYRRLPARQTSHRHPRWYCARPWQSQGRVTQLLSAKSCEAKAGFEIFKIGSRSLARPPDSQRHHGSPCHPRSWIAPIVGSCHPRSGFQRAASPDSHSSP
jgi:hypothetical protein